MKKQQEEMEEKCRKTRKVTGDGGRHLIFLVRYFQNNVIYL